MVSQSPTVGRRFHSVAGALAVAAIPLFLAVPAHAQTAIYAPGEPIVTGFSGITPPDQPPPSGDPLDTTFINLDGSSMVIQQLQPDGPPKGQLIASPPAFAAKARDVGQVFGITLDNAPDITGAAAPNIYLSATSAFGLNLVVDGPDGKPVRTRTGAAGARFMDGQWGTAGGATGTPGSIWKVDGTTGQISLFTTIAANTGAGLGDIVFDPASQQFFASDLDTGLIYRLASDGTIIDTFDHGVNGRPTHGLAAVADDGSEIDVTSAAFDTTDPKTWGFTQPERRVYGLAVHNGRLYYAVAKDLSIWSIGLNLDGSFAGDPRWELDVTGLPSDNEITNIVFDPEGRMILAQRGAVTGSYDYTTLAESKTSSVVRYTREVPDDPSTPSTWVETPQSYAVGFPPEGNNASGGIALGYGYDSSSSAIGGACSAYLWSTGDSLRDASAINPPLDPALDPPAQVHGLQGNDRSLVRPENDPPLSSYFTDYDGNTDDSTAAEQGHVGDVEIWQKCQGVPSEGYVPPYFPPPGYVPPPDGNLTLTKRARPEQCFDWGTDWACHFVIRVRNTSPGIYWGPLTVDDWLPDNNPGATMYFWPQPPWSCAALGPTEYQCDHPPVVLFPGESVDLHELVKLPKAGNDYCYLNNAAALEWLYGYRDSNPSDDFDSAWARIPDPRCEPHGDRTNLKLEKIAHPSVCSQGGGGWDCNFYIRVTNTGPGDYNAPIQVRDTLPFAMPTSYALAPPWSCVPAGPTLTCDRPAVLLHPGQFVLLRITATVPYNVARDQHICELRNRAQITQAPGGSALNTNPADDADDAIATIPAEDCNPDHPRTDLSLRKDAIGCVTQPGGAAGAPNGAVVCAFRVTVRNEGPNPFAGNVVVHDAFAPPIPPAQLLTAPPGICAPAGGGYDCTLNGVNLLVGQTRMFFIGFRLPLNTQICDVRNTARITSPAGGTNLNFNPANDQGVAGLNTNAPGCNPPRTDLSLVKRAADCPPILTRVENSAACFDVTIRNQGPGPFNGPLHFLDHPSVALEDLNAGAGLTCSPAGADYDCASNGNVALNVGGSVTYHLTMVFANQRGQVCTLTNRARLTTPAGGTPLNTNPGNDAGSDSVTVTVGNCAPPVEPAKQCDITQRMPDGGCCPDGQVWKGRACGAPGGGKPPVIVRQCPQDSHGVWPNCVCDSGTHGTPGKCVPDKPAPQCPANSSGDYPRCICDQGYHHATSSLTSACVPNQPAPQCPAHSSGDYPTCYCDKGYHHATRSLTSACVPNVTPQQCPAHSSGDYPTCYCDKGYHHATSSLTSACVPNVTPPQKQCPAHSSGTYPRCICDQCYHHSTRSLTSSCVPNVTGPITINPNVLNPPVIKCTAPHSHAEGGRCVCDSGYVGSPPRCTPVGVLKQAPSLLLNAPPNQVIR